MGRALQLELYKPDGSNGEADPNMSRPIRRLGSHYEGPNYKKVADLYFNKLMGRLLSEMAHQLINQVATWDVLKILSIKYKKLKTCLGLGYER